MMLRDRTLPLVLSAAALLALGACSSDDDDAGGTVEQTPGDQTSMLNPDLDDNDAPLSSEPGDDTSDIAGFYNASGPDEAADRRYVDLAGNGLYSEFTLDEDGLNCYDVLGPQTITLENADIDGNDYSLADGRSFRALRLDDDALEIVFLDDSDEGEVMLWPSVGDGLLPSGLQRCESEMVEPSDTGDEEGRSSGS